MSWVCGLDESLQHDMSSLSFAEFFPAYVRHTPRPNVPVRHVTNSFAAEVTWFDAFICFEVSSDGLSAGRTKVLTGRVTADDDDDDDKLVCGGEQGGGRAESGKDKAPEHREEEGSDENKGGAGWGLLRLLTLAAMTVYARLLLVSSRLALLKVCLTRPCLSEWRKEDHRFARAHVCE